MTESQLESFDFDALKIVQNLCQSNESPVPNIERRLFASLSKKRNQDTHAMATLHRMKKSRPKETLTLAQFSQKSFTSFAEWRASLRKMFLSVEPYTSFVLKFHFFEDD